MATSKDLLASLAIRMSVDAQSMGKQLNQVKNKLNVAKSGMRALGAAVAAAFSVYAIANFTKEIITLSGKLQGVKNAFDHLGQPQLLDELRKATRGTVDDLKLMQQAITAKNFKIPLDQLATYMEFARRRAKATGEEVDYLINSLVVGLGRKSAKIIDNLGISLLEVQQEVEKVGDFSIAVGNIISREMGNMEEDTHTVTEEVDSLAASWMNFKLQLSQTSGGYWMKQLKEINQYLRILDSDSANFFHKWLAFWNQDYADEWGQWLDAAEAVMDEAIKKATQTGEDIREAILVPMIAPPELDKLPTVWDDINAELELYELLWEQAYSKENLLEVGLKIEALKKEKKELEDIAKNYLEIAELQRSQSDLKASLLGGFTPMEGIGLKPGAVQTEAGDIWGYDSMLQSFVDFNADHMREVQKALAQQQIFADGIIALNQELNWSFQDLASTVGVALGQLAATGKFNSGMFLEFFAGVAERLGKLAIGIGTASISIEAALESFGGPGAIAAGIALVALAQAARSGMQNIASGGTGGIAAAPTYGNNESYFRQFGQVDKEMKVIYVEGIISGENIRLANVRATKKHEMGL